MNPVGELIILELQHRLVRQTINIAVGKAMEDMKTSTKRSIRNLVDLGLLYAQTENQKNFFGIAKKIISNQKNPYHSLITRMITDVDNDTIKKVGLNLGYSSLIHGAGKLKKRWKSTGTLIPWLIIFDMNHPDPDFFSDMELCIQKGRNLGIYSYIVRLYDAKDIPGICRIAKQYDECMFALKVVPGLITDETAEAIGNINNMMVSVQAESAESRLEDTEAAFSRLRQSRCLYGFHVNYNEEAMYRLTTPEYIRSAIDTGCVFGIYIAEENASDGCRDTVYHFARRTRGESGQPLLTMDWYRDIHDISEKILSGDGYLAISPSFLKTKRLHSITI